MRKNSQAAQKGPDARRRPRAAREAYSLYVERAAEGANAADGPFSAACEFFRILLGNPVLGGRLHVSQRDVPERVHHRSPGLDKRKQPRQLPVREIETLRLR